MEEAVKVAYERSKEGDAVLLSPACASWDMYDNFEQRGEHFKACVREIEMKLRQL
jgi:UDP-N-acetylmuramoylalanine--D-glutamate ligase